MLSSETIDAFLFDMDGLLLDTERLAFRCWSNAAREFGYELEESLFSQMVGRRVADNRSLVQAALGADFPYWEVRDRRLELMEDYIAQDGIPVKAGAESLLQKLGQRAKVCAVVTSTDSDLAHKKLSHAELLPYFREVFGPEPVPRGKPAPDCYLYASKQLSIAPERCVVLEDSPYGVEAGLAAGMKVIWVPDMVQPTPELAKRVAWVAPDLDAVSRHLFPE